MGVFSAYCTYLFLTQINFNIMKKVFLIILVLCSTFSVVAQQYDTAVSPLKGEKLLRWVAKCLLIQQQSGTIWEGRT